MKRTLIIVMVAVVSFVLGAGCMYVLKRQPKPTASDGWIGNSPASDLGQRRPKVYTRSMRAYRIPLESRFYK